MDNSEEIVRLRSDLAALMHQAQALGRRLEALEEARAAPPSPAESSSADGNASGSRPSDEATAAPPENRAPAVPPPLPIQLPEAAATSPKVVDQPASARERPALSSAPSWTLGDGLRKVYRVLGPKESMNWEMALGTYWLPRLAILLMSIGVVWGLTLAVQKWGSAWTPHIRIATGYTIAAGLFFGGRSIERRRRDGALTSYLDYARVMMAGGMALVYFVTFAMYYVPYTRIFAGPEIPLCLLSAIMLSWGLTANWRRSWTMAFAVTLLGHFTAGLSSLTLSHPPTATIVGLLALNLGAGYFIARFGWRLVGLAGVIGGYGNYLIWLDNSSPSSSLWALIGAMSVLVTYWLVFAVSEFIAAGKSELQVSYRIRSLYQGINSGGLLLLGTGLISGFDIAVPYRFLFFFACAIAFLTLSQLYLRRRNGDLLYGWYLTKASAVFALGLADYFQGSALTLTLAVQAVVLLYSARRSGLVTPRALAMATLAAALIHGMALKAFLGHAPDSPLQADALLSALATLLAVLYFSVLYERTEWPKAHHANAGLSVWFSHALRLLDLMEGPPIGAKKPPNDFTPGIIVLPIAALAAIFGTLLAAFDFAHALDVNTCLSLQAATALSLLIAGITIRTRALAYGSLMGACCALLFCIAATLHYQTPFPPDVQFWIALGVGMVCLLAMGELWRITRSLAGRRWAILFDAQELAYAHVVSAIVVLAWTFRILLPEGVSANLLMALSAGASLYAWRAGSPPLGLSTFLCFIPATLESLHALQADTPLSQSLLRLGLATVPLLMVEAKWVGQRAGLCYHQNGIGPYGLHFGVAAMIWKLSAHVCPGYTADYALGATGLVYGLLAAILHQRAMTAVAIGSFLVAAAHWNLNGTSAPILEMTNLPPEVVFSCWSVAVLALLTGRLPRVRKAFDGKTPEALLVILAWGMLAEYVTEAAPQDWIHVRGLLLAFGFFAYGGLIRNVVAVGLAFSTAAAGTFIAAVAAYDGLPVTPRIAALALALAFWFCTERAFSRGVRRGDFSARLDGVDLRAGLIALPPVLLVIMLERVPVLASFYLTVAWTVAGTVVMLFAIAARERYYRYAGLCIYALALGRVLLVDTQRLEGIYRILAFLFLGLVLLGVGFGYIKARERAAASLNTHPDSEAH